MNKLLWLLVPVAALAGLIIAGVNGVWLTVVAVGIVATAVYAITRIKNK